MVKKRSKTKGTVNYPITMDTQPAQQQGDIKFHNYLVSFIRFDPMFSLILGMVWTFFTVSIPLQRIRAVQ